MTTDAELVALLLTEARAKRAWDAAPLDTPAEPRTYEAYVRGRVALDAAVQERLAAESELRAAVLGRLEAERGSE